MSKAIKISDDTYKKIWEIARHKKRLFTQILTFAVDLYYKITIGNTLKTRK